jgi:hypothetical protein
MVAKLLLVAGIITLAGNAVAIPITGSIGFSGDYTVAGGNLATATSIDITGDDATVTGTVDGTFAAEGVSAGDTATYNDFTFSPFAPVNDLWSIGGFSFDLNTLSIDFQSSSFLALSGSGLISYAGYADTAGLWTFTATTSGSNFTFASSSASDSVPEPGIALLLGIGLVGLGLSRTVHKTT